MQNRQVRGSLHTVFSSCLIGLALLNPIRMSAQDSSLRVITWNIRYDNPADDKNNWHFRKAELAGFIAAESPAIIGLQEALQNQVHYLDSVLINYDFIGVGRDDGKTGGEYAPIFYDTSVLILIAFQTIWLSETPEIPSTGWDAALPRICTTAQFRIRDTGDTVYVLNTHFDHVGDTARIRSAQIVCDKIRSLPDSASVICMGDLNATDHSAVYTVFSNALRDTRIFSKTIPKGPQGTFQGFAELTPASPRIDYIFTRNCVIMQQEHYTNLRSTGEWMSDHLAVGVRLQIRH